MNLSCAAWASALEGRVSPRDWPFPGCHLQSSLVGASALTL